MLDFWMALIKLSSGIFEGFKIAKTLQTWSKSPNCFNDSGAEKERKMKECLFPPWENDVTEDFFFLLR